MRKKELYARIAELEEQSQSEFDAIVKAADADHAELGETKKELEKLKARVVDLTAENERIKKERDEALEKYHSALVRVVDYAVKEYYSYASRFPEDRGLKEEGAQQ